MTKARDLFTVEVRQLSAGSYVIALAGELDLAGVPDLTDALARLPPDADRTFVDLSQLSFIDSSGLRLLIEAAKSAQERGATMILVGPTPTVQRVFQIVGVADLVPVEATLEAAIEKLALDEV
jgi:anti-sigma B factor antagonist